MGVILRKPRFSGDAGGSALTVDFFGDNSCKAFFPFNQSLTDLTGNHTLSGSDVTYVDGKYGKSANIGSGASFSPSITFSTTGNYTLTFWGNPGLSESTSSVFFLGESAYAYIGFHSGQWWTGSSSNPQGSFTVPPSVSFYALAFSGSDCACYLNGSLNGEYSTYSMSAITNIGYGMSGASMNYEHVRVFNRTLSASEIAALYAAA